MRFWTNICRCFCSFKSSVHYESDMSERELFWSILSEKNHLHRFYESFQTIHSFIYWTQQMCKKQIVKKHRQTLHVWIQKPHVMKLTEMNGASSTYLD